MSCMGGMHRLTSASASNGGILNSISTVPLIFASCGARSSTKQMPATCIWPTQMQRKRHVFVFFCQKIWSKQVDAVETSKTHHQKNLTPRGFKKPLNHPRVETGNFPTLCPLHICWRRRELCQQAQWYILTRPANVGFFVDITGWVDMFTGEECTLGGGAVN